ncbi:3-oxoacyl-ACP synthase III family protein [Streptomyces sp. NPDC051366]|uniref:3-oxoacyl-ACP synthase III family protein n=1 Tax=Streptomyces sp. NPDC051366 TaxID=3365652 RepID=UPI0037B1834D
MSVYSRITQVAVHVPDGRQTSEAIEDRLRAHSPALRIPPGLLYRMYGLKERVVTGDDVLPSDLASHAALQALHQARLEPGDVDLLLFASVSADVQEPANAHIVAAKTGLTCPVFDVSNACNSVLNALEVADALIRCGRYQQVLVACGEALSRLSRWTMTCRAEMRTALASMTGGDMGAALIVEASTEPGIIASTFMANSTGWPAATLFNPHQAPGRPHALDIDSEQLLASFLGLDTRARQWLKEHDTDPGELSLVCVHQPSVPFVDTFSERLGVRPGTVVPTFARTGNVAAATLPLQLALAGEQDRLHPGMKIALFGLASGASGGVMLINWTASGTEVSRASSS